MPLAHLQYKRDRGLEEIAARLAMELPAIVSRALDVPGNGKMRLTPDEIEVPVDESGKFSVNIKDIEIRIIAHDYPERTNDIEERKDFILGEIRRFLADYDRNLTGWVWVLPQQKTAFGKI